MTVSSRGIATPDDGTIYNPPVDLAAMAVSIETNDIGKGSNAYTGTSAQRTAFTTARNGVIWVDTNGAKGVYRRDGTSWVRIDAKVHLTGTATITATAAAGATTKITFASGTFSAPPHVFVSKQSGGGAKYTPYANNVTATGCDLGIFSGDGTAGTQTVYLSWMAVAV